MVSQSNAADDDPIFVVRNKEGKIVFAVFQTGVRVYLEDTATKGAKWGFAVGGLSGQSKRNIEYFRITADSARIFVNEILSTKSTRGNSPSDGSPTRPRGGSANFFNVSTNSKSIINPSEKRAMWYPLKNAFLAGQVIIEYPDRVGENSNTCCW